MAQCTNVCAQPLDDGKRYVRVNQFAADKAVVVHVGRAKSAVTLNLTDEEAIALRDMLIATYRDIPVPAMANHRD